MSKPTDLAPWATDTDYSGGPKNGTPTKVVPGAGVFEQGHYPGEKTAAQNQNEWQNRVGRWIEYIDTQLFDDYTETGFLTPAKMTGNFAIATLTPIFANSKLNINTGILPATSTAAIPVKVRDGLKVTNITLNKLFTRGNSETFVVTIEKSHADGSANTILHTENYNTNDVATWAPLSIDFDSGTGDGTFGLEIRMSLTSADAGMGVAYSLAVVGEISVTHSLP